MILTGMRYVAFLRAINVGGRVVKMHHLRSLCEAIPLDNVSTFIASGNVIFDSRRLPAQLEGLIEKKLKGELGYQVATMLRAAGDLQAIVKYVGDAGLEEGGSTRLYVGFLKTAPAAAMTRAVSALSNDVDLLSVRGREIYWICRTSMTESTFAGARLEKLLQGPVTFRNVNTVRRLVDRVA